MTKGTNVCCYAVFPTKIFVEYVGTNMGIQVPLLVIDRRRVSVMSTLFSNRRVRTLKVSMTVIMSLCILMYRRSSEPGCDHGHDEESRNGRDVKNDILEAYVWTSDAFQVKSGFYRNTGRVTGTPREHNGPTWALEER